MKKTVKHWIASSLRFSQRRTEANVIEERSNQDNQKTINNDVGATLAVTQ
jgi:hypothetical protein